MTAKFYPPSLRQAFERLQQIDGACAELAAAVNSRGTLVLALPFMRGGLTLNALNLIVLESRLCNSGQRDMLACLLVHECSHIQQRHLVDSIQQELIAYQAEAQVEQALQRANDQNQFGFALTLDGTKPDDLEKARTWILQLAGDALPTQTIYRRLPLYQPMGVVQNVKAGLVQILSGGVAALQLAWLVGKEWYARMRRRH